MMSRAREIPSKSRAHLHRSTCSSKGSSAVDEIQSPGVSVAPNESKIRGKITRIQPGPEGVGQVWEVEVTESIESGSTRDFARAYVGKTLLVYIHPDLKKRLKENDYIEARIFYQGDARNGAFFLIGDDVQKIKGI